MSDKGRRFLTGRLARRVFLFFGLSALLPLALMAFLSLAEVREMLLEQGERRLAAGAKSYGMAVFERILLAQEVAASAASRAESGLPEDSLARRGFASLGAFEGERLARALIGQPVLPPLGPQARERLAQGKPVVVVEKAGPAARVHLVAPQASGGGATMAGELAAASLWGSVDLHPAATHFCVFEDATRLTLFCSAPDADAAAKAIDPAASQSSLRSVRWLRDGEPQRGVAWGQFMRAQFGARDWIFVASQPESFLVAPVTEFRQIFVPVVILALLLVAWLTVRQARSIVVPVEDLARRARAISRNEFPPRLELKREDELGELATAFDNMSSRLGQQFATLKALSDVDRLILASGDTEQVVRTVIDRMGGAVSADAIGVTLFDRKDSGGARAYFHAQGSGTGLSVSRLEISAAQLEALAAEKGGAWIALAGTAGGPLAPLREAGLRSAFVQPIVWRGAACGLLALGYRAEQARDDEAPKQAMEFGDRIAVAVSSAWRDEQLYLQAHYDSLTGLPNRLLFEDRLGQMVVRCEREKERFAVLFIDLDRFKDVNDTYGHSVGDAVLQEAARRITKCVRASDTVSRLGGDEFTVLVTNLNRPQDAGRIAEAIVHELSRAFDAGGQESFLGASVGIALFPADGTGTEELLKNADTAMYRAKAGGRSQAVYFEERMNREAIARVELDRDLHLAIDRGELVLHYQPLLDLRSGAIRAAEALVRWRHPERGTIAPARFIPLAEETGFIDQVGQWVIREACLQLKAWRTEGLPLEIVAVNVSPRQFRKSGLVDAIRGCVEEAGIAASSLEIEITEGLLVDHSTAVGDMLSRLASMGVGIALDDFGTGFSSMAYLKRFPVHTIKIDRAFVEGLGRSDDSEAIVAAVIQMSHTLGKRVVAEGVETDEQLALLRSLGCDEIQGFCLAPALPAAEFRAFVRSRSGAAA